MVVAALFGGFVGDRAMHTQSFGGPAILVMANGGAVVTMLLGLVFTIFETTRKFGVTTAEGRTPDMTRRPHRSLVVRVRNAEGSRS